MKPVDLSLRLLKACCLHGLLQRGAGPDSFRPLPFPHDPPRHPVIEAPQHPSNGRDHYPDISAKEQYGLKYG